MLEQTVFEMSKTDFVILSSSVMMESFLPLSNLISAIDRL